MGHISFEINSEMQMKRLAVLVMNANFVQLGEYMMILELTAIKLYQEGALTLEKATKLANISIEALIEKLGSLGVPIVNYPSTDLRQELKDFE